MKLKQLLSLLRPLRSAGRQGHSDLRPLKDLIGGGSGPSLSAIAALIPANPSHPAGASRTHANWPDYQIISSFHTTVQISTTFLQANGRGESGGEESDLPRSLRSSRGAWEGFWW